jgi:hypothetical protein
MTPATIDRDFPIAITIEDADPIARHTRIRAQPE